MKSEWKVEAAWTTEAGYNAVVIFLQGPKHRCGYVAVGKGHPLFGVDNPYFLDEESPERALIESVRVHWGITYAKGNSDYPVFVPHPVWWFGFDCAHCDDLPAGAEPLYPGQTHKNLDFCIAECERMADGLKLTVSASPKSTRINQD